MLGAWLKSKKNNLEHMLFVKVGYHCTLQQDTLKAPLGCYTCLLLLWTDPRMGLILEWMDPKNNLA